MSVTRTVQHLFAMESSLDANLPPAASDALVSRQAGSHMQPDTDAAPAGQLETSRGCQGLSCRQQQTERCGQAGSGPSSAEEVRLLHGAWRIQSVTLHLVLL
jgi:hypothetical protein